MLRTDTQTDRNGANPDRGTDRSKPEPGAAAKASRSSRRRTFFTGFAVLILGAIGALYLYSYVTTESPTLVAASSIARGEVVEASDLRVVNVNAPEGIAYLDPAQQNLIVGQTARIDIESGAVITPNQFADVSDLTGDQVIAGVVLEPGGYPTPNLTAGDVVSLVLTPSPSSGDLDAGAAALLAQGSSDVIARDVLVVSVVDFDNRAAKFISLRLTEEQAAAFSKAADQGRLRLIQVEGGA